MCGRRGRPNVIVLSGQGSAGIGDRKAIFAHYGLLAEALCAAFQVPPPSEMLSLKHNRNQTVSSKRWWDDYFLALNGDGDRLLERISSTGEPTVSRDLKLVDQFRQAANSSNPFVWHLDQYYFAHGTSRHAPELWEAVVSRIGDAEVEFQESKYVKDLALDFHSRYKPFLTVHVRRGDNLGRCNSSIPMVVHKLECEGLLRRLEEEEKMYLVIFSDEVESLYVRDLIDQLTSKCCSSKNNNRSSVVWGDEVIRSMISSHDSRMWEDNYLVYETSVALRRRVGEGDLDIGRHKHCTKC